MNGQSVVNPVEARSSPSHISATKGSSIWLHWNYTYVGDGTHNNGNNRVTTRLEEQKYKGNDQVLESPVPVPFNGRVEVISVNSTLVIHGLQYNDSTYQFSSYVNVGLDAGGGPEAHPFPLKPVVSITVNGMSCCNAILFCNTI